MTDADQLRPGTVTDEAPRKLMTIYLPLPAGCFADILQDVGRHYPNAVLKSQTISIVHVMSAAPAEEGEPSGD